MADKAISQLTQATQITATDLFVLQQSNEAKSLPGQVLLNWLTAAADGHGGISTITGPVTAGLVDTYTITYADQTTSQFTVTNGAKGDTGEQGDTWYTHIRYSARDPVADSDVKVQADDWMGIYTGISPTAPASYTGYTWFKIKGEIGDTGTSITGVTKTGTVGLVDTYTVSFSDGTSTTFTVTNGSSIQSIDKTRTVGLTDTYTVTLTDGTTETFTVANGRGITSITPVDVTRAAGHTDEYRMNFNDGDTFTFYIYNGTNGTGSVSTVDGIPAANQNVDLLTIGTGAPTATTVGGLKSRYFDTATGILYICLGSDNSGPETTYTWAGAGVTVDQSFSTMSTNPLQNAVLTARIGTAALDTTAQTLADAINELAGDADVARMAIGNSPPTSATAGSVGSRFFDSATGILYICTASSSGVQTWTKAGTPVEDMLGLCYPVGSIYISVNSTSPAALFGGTWEQLKDRFLLGVGDTYTTPDVDGGDATINLSHTHTTAGHQLSEGELPSHAHGFRYNVLRFGSGDTGIRNMVAGGGSITTTEAVGSNWSHSHGDTGSALSASQSIIPPYHTVYMWKRTA